MPYVPVGSYSIELKLFAYWVPCLTTLFVVAFICYLNYSSLRALIEMSLGFCDFPLFFRILSNRSFNVLIWETESWILVSGNYYCLFVSLISSCFWIQDERCLISSLVRKLLIKWERIRFAALDESSPISFFLLGETSFFSITSTFCSCTLELSDNYSIESLSTTWVFED